jgi:hypothetical protein
MSYYSRTDTLAALFVAIVMVGVVVLLFGGPFWAAFGFAVTVYLCLVN